MRVYFGLTKSRQFFFLYFKYTITVDFSPVYVKVIQLFGIEVAFFIIIWRDETNTQQHSTRYTTVQTLSFHTHTDVYVTSTRTHMQFIYHIYIYIFAHSKIELIKYKINNKWIYRKLIISQLHSRWIVLPLSDWLYFVSLLLSALLVVAQHSQQRFVCFVCLHSSLHHWFWLFNFLF